MALLAGGAGGFGRGREPASRLSNRGRRWGSLFGLAFLLWAGGATVPAQSPNREFQLKAAFLFNFAQFVEWPRTAFPATDTPIVIGILGEDPFGSVLDDIVRNELVHGRKLVVRRFATAEEIELVHILYLSKSEAGRTEDWLSKLKGKPILTVGETDRFAFRGGVVRFITDNKIRLRINTRAARNAELTISSKLLRLAEIVDE